MRVTTIPAEQYLGILREHVEPEQIGGLLEVEDFTWYDFTDEIEAGVALLDRHDPKWHQGISLDWLSLSSGANCVLGQLAMRSFRTMIEGTPMWTGYDSVIKALHERGEVNDPYGISHGFCLPDRHPAFYAEDGYCDDEDSRRRDAWEHLTWQWADVVRKRVANNPA
jgi:hypothetical protein